VCLLLTIRLSERDAARAPEIASAATAACELEVSACRRLLRRRSRELNICETRQGCGCSLLADDADWDAPAWSMRPEALPQLGAALAAVRQQTSDGFTFQALWVGETAFHDKHVSPEQMLAIVASGQISTDSRYLVT
jgi:hypothetical protein